jgi:hypothetical protein
MRSDTERQEKTFHAKQKAQTLPDVGEKKKLLKFFLSAISEFALKIFLSEIAFFKDNSL